jgi:solute carrier family 13 (sodium-dependent dicarboxylate transporter), member 2/3/5
MNIQRLFFWLGPAAFLLCCCGNFGLERPAQMMLGIVLWMGIWWIFEAVPLAVTALLPLVLFPATGIASLKKTATEYSNEIVFLFLAGFILGKAIEKWQLHRRIALAMIAKIGTREPQILLGFISMWISNTATAIMMLPVALAVAGKSKFDEKSGNNFAKNLMLGIAYAASIGGMATVIGTPTNAIFLNFVKEKYPDQTVSFGKWLAFGLPYATILLIFCWWMLCRIFPMQNIDNQQEKHVIFDELKKLGRISAPEKRVLLLFGLVIFGWVGGSFFWYGWFEKVLGIGDAFVAISGAILLFLIPADGFRGEKLMDWPTAEKIPWGVLLLFGGGLAMATGFEASGLAKSLAEGLKSLTNWPIFWLILVVLLVIVLLSEVASNIATASMMMPVLAALAGILGIEPVGILMIATLASSVGFMLPIATAPNTIVFSSGYLRTKDMIRAGFWLDLAAIFLLLAFVFWVMPTVWGVSL